MFNLFGNKNNNNEATGIPPEWIQQTQETQDRWFVFLQKLEERMEDLCSGAVVEIKEMVRDADGNFDMNIHQVQSGVIGQISQMLNKANATREQKIEPFYNQLCAQLSSAHLSEGFAHDFREACSSGLRTFEATCSNWRDQLLNATKSDSEAEYKKILEEFESIKNKFNCQQCGSPVAIDKMYFTSTYLKCPACGTQNTYEPSSLARTLPFLARTLAEERTIHLANADDSPQAYRNYLRAMTDEWNRLVPDMAEANEKFYDRLLMDYNNSVV